MGRVRPEPRHVCEICGARFRLNYSGQRTCGRACGAVLKRRNAGLPDRAAAKPAPAPRECSECGAEYESAHALKRTCSPGCSTARSRRVSLATMNANYRRMRPRIIANAHARRAALLAQTVEDVDPRVVFERDGWRCGICGKRTRREGRWKRDPEVASLDHIVPIADGGEHSYANTRCTHLGCNIARGKRGGGEQLALL